MSDAYKNKEQSHLLLNFVLIVLETVFSFILKNDGVIRLQAKHFVERKIRIRINSYIPYFDFYVQFTDKGILFDRRAPEEDVDLEVSGTLIDLIKIFIFANQRSINSLRIGGEATLKEQFKELLMHFSLPKVMADWKHWLGEPSSDEDTAVSKKRLAPLLRKIETQRSQINNLNVEVLQHKNRIKRITRRYQFMVGTLAGLVVVLFLILMYTLWIN